MVFFKTLYCVENRLKSFLKRSFERGWFRTFGLVIKIYAFVDDFVISKGGVFYKLNTITKKSLLILKINFAR